MSKLVQKNKYNQGYHDHYNNGHHKSTSWILKNIICDENYPKTGKVPEHERFPPPLEKRQATFHRWANICFYLLLNAYVHIDLVDADDADHYLQDSDS